MYYDGSDINEGIDLVKSNKSNECMICHYSLFNHGFEFQDFVCNGYHDFTKLRLNTSDISIITLENIDYRYVIITSANLKQLIYYKNSVLEDRGYI